MSERPTKPRNRSIVPARPSTSVPVRAADEVVQTKGARGFLRFQYSCTEVSSGDGRTQVRSSTTRFGDGKLTRETFEGELEGGAYIQMVDEAQRRMLRSLSWFLPWAPRLRSDK